MPDLLIIGIGNPLRGDDGAGWQAAELLSARISRKGLQIIASHQLTPEMAEPIGEAALVIFIDADVNVSPGELSWSPVEPGTAESKSLSHHVSPSTLLESARQIYGRSPRAFLASIGPETFDYGQPLSPSVSRRLSLLLDQLERLAECEGHEIIKPYTHIDS